MRIELEHMEIETGAEMETGFALANAVISQAASLKRIADYLEKFGGPQASDLIWWATRLGEAFSLGMRGR